MSKPIKVLSIDGGGIRGIIPAMVLAKLEEITNKSTFELFDLIAGTSTGGILALGLTVSNGAGKARYSAKNLVALYENEGRNIFSRSPWHRISSAEGLLEEKYPSEGIEKVLQKYFGEARLKDSLKNVIITSYEIEKRFPFFFKTIYAKDPQKTATYDFPIKQVGRATSAAPTFFEPVKINQGNEYYVLIDGGVYANNPAMCAFVEAKQNNPNSEDFLVVSLGTGELERPIPYKEAKDWGQAQWVQPILGVVFDGVNDTVDYQLQQLLSSDRYYRLQTQLREGNDDIDDASRTNLRVLKLIAEELIQSNITRIQSLAKALVS